jgi:agmatinase
MTDTTSHADSGSVPHFLDAEPSSQEDADAAVLSVPYEGTVSYGTGTAEGPAAVIGAGPHLETFDEELEWESDGSLKVATLRPIVPDPAERPESFMARLKGACAGLGLVPPFPLTFGGEHSITPAVLAGIRDDLTDVTVVQIDAHADLRDSYHGSRDNHACAMRRVLDLGVRRLIAVGIRSCTADEFALARDDERIDTLYAHQMHDPVRWQRLLEDLRALEGPVYLTVDIDGLDCTLCPGTGTPQPGGLSWEQALDVVRATVRESRAEVFGADVVEVAPMAQSQVNEMVAAKLGFKILAYRFAPGRWGR